MQAQSTPPFATTEINDCLSHRGRSNFKGDGEHDSARRAESNVVAASAFVITKLDLVPIRAPFAARKAKAARLTRIQKGRFEDGLFAN